MSETPSKTPRMNEMVWKSDHLRELYTNLSAKELETIHHLLEYIVNDPGYIAFFSQIKSFNNPHPYNPDFFKLNLQGTERDLWQDPERSELYEVDCFLRNFNDARRYLQASPQTKTAIQELIQRCEPYIFSQRSQTGDRMALFMSATAPGYTQWNGSSLYHDACKEMPRPFECRMVLQTSERIGTGLARIFSEYESMIFHVMRGLCQIHGDADRANMDFELCSNGSSGGSRVPVIDFSEAYELRRAEDEARANQRKLDEERERQEAAIAASRKTLGGWLKGLFKKG